MYRKRGIQEHSVYSYVLRVIIIQCMNTQDNLLCTRDTWTHNTILDVYICTKCCQCQHGVRVTIESSPH